MPSPKLHDQLRRINARRRAGVPSPHPAEPRLERRFAPAERLAVYGSLVPEQSNATQLEAIAGTWSTGHVRGHLQDRGWGSGQGYPGLVWDPRGPEVPVSILTAPALPRHWDRLDAFEGDEYCRVLVPVRLEDGEITVANLYALRE